MPNSFVVYIDESGDEGFNFERNSSQWFIVSAVLIPFSEDARTVKLVVDTTRRIFKRKDTNPFHFRDMVHHRRVPYVDIISKASLHLITIAIYKPAIEAPEAFASPHALYSFATFLLFERICSYCEARSIELPVKIVLSNRSHLKREKFCEDFEETQKGGLFKINAQLIQSNDIFMESTKIMGLQIADAVASSFFYALSLDEFNFNEDRYVRLLSGVIHNQNGIYENQGITIYPQVEELKTLPHLTWLREYFGF